MSDNRHDEQEDFLTRWSRRKAKALKGELPPEPEDDADDATLQEIDALQEAPAAADEDTGRCDDEGAAAEADTAPELPELDSLDADSDYSAFMGKGVPADLRQQALRKLFHSPKFNIRDGLDDYDWDMTSLKPLGNIITAEMRYRVERELERLAGLDEDEQIPQDSPAVAAADTGEHDTAGDPLDPEADDDRTESS